MTCVAFVNWFYFLSLPTRIKILVHNNHAYMVLGVGAPVEQWLAYKGPSLFGELLLSVSCVLLFSGSDDLLRREMDLFEHS